MRGDCPAEISKVSSRPRKTAVNRRCGSPAVSRLVLGALAPLLLSGCGKSVRLGQVDGTVRFDGKPIGQVLVTFIPEDPHLPQSSGVTDAEGRFQLRCSNGGMGAAVGEHRVTLLDATAAPASKSREDDEIPEGNAAPVRRVPPNYSRADKTPLRRSVAPGTQSLEIDNPSKP